MGKNDYNRNNQYGGNRAGIQPEREKNPSFILRTTDIESSLQNKLNSLYSAANMGKAPKIDIKSVEMSRMFYPFVVSLTPDCIYGNNEGETKINAFFHADNSEQYVKLEPIIFNLFKNYVYDKDDKKAFFSDSFRRELGLSKDKAVMLESLRQPKIMKFNNDKEEYIIFLIDPLRVFHDMLTNDGEKQDFLLDIPRGKTKKINTGIYQYKVVKYPAGSKNKKGKNKSHISELEARIRNQSYGNEKK